MDVVKSNRIVFKDLLGKYSYKVLMTNPDVNIKSDIATEIISLYREIESVNLRQLSHTDWDGLDFRDKQKIQLQIQFDAVKQRQMFIDIIGQPAEFISDVLVKALQDDVNKDTLWRLFGDVIYNNIQRNLAGTKICKNCGKRFNYDSDMDRNIYCDNCKRIKHAQKIKKLRENNSISCIKK